jgi:arylsulfatase A-like enzyme
MASWHELDRLDDPPRARRPFLLPVQDRSQGGRLANTYDVQSPYEVTPEPFRSHFASEVEEPPEAYRSNMSGAMAEVWKAASTTDPPRLDDVQVAWAVAMYDGGIRHVDDWFGRFMGLLEGVGVRQQSIVVVISDHGDEFQEHGSLFHSRLYATVTRIPLIIRFPGDGGGWCRRRSSPSISCRRCSPPWAHRAPTASRGGA